MRSSDRSGSFCHPRTRGKRWRDKHKGMEGCDAIVSGVTHQGLRRTAGGGGYERAAGLRQGQAPTATRGMSPIPGGRGAWPISVQEKIKSSATSLTANGSHWQAPHLWDVHLTEV